MDKWEAQYAFWRRFGLPVYEENSVPTGADRPEMPYITYNAVNSTFGTDASGNASIWTRAYSWAQADELANAVEAVLKDGGAIQRYDGGALWYSPDTVLIQSMGAPNDNLVKRKLISVVVHFS